MYACHVGAVFVSYTCRLGFLILKSALPRSKKNGMDA